MKFIRRNQLTGHNASIYALSNFQKGHFLSGGGEGWIVQWDLKDPELGKLVAKVETQVFSLHYIAETSQIVAGNMNGGVHWIPIDKPDETKNIAHHKKGCFGFIQLGQYLFSVGGDGQLTKWDISNQRTVESLFLTNQSLRCIDYAPELNLLAIGASDNQIYFVYPDTMGLAFQFKDAHANSVFALKFSPDQRLLYSGGRDAMLKVWDMSSWECLSSQPAHWYTINDISIHPKGHLFATGSRDKTVKIWDATSFKLLKVLDTIRDSGHVNSVNTLLWSEKEEMLISGSDDRTIMLWQEL